MSNIGVIFAGGVGRRMHTKEKPKQFLEIWGKPIIVRTIEYFQENPDIDAVVVVCVEDWIPYFEKLQYQYRLDKVKKVVHGGETGQLSIYAGLCAAEELARDHGYEISSAQTYTGASSSARVDRTADTTSVSSIAMAVDEPIVLIHDGVRPLITSRLLSQNIEAVKKYGNCITSGLVQETIVEISDDNDVLLVPDRKHSRVAKAPQSFYLRDVLAAHRKALSEGITDFIDTCTMMQHYGYRLHMIDGPHENIKITTPEDYYIMQGILQARENAQIYGLDEGVN